MAIRSNEVKESKNTIGFINTNAWPGRGDNINLQMQFKRRSCKIHDWALSIKCQRDTIYGTETVKQKALKKCNDCGTLHFKEIEKQVVKEKGVYEHIMLGRDDALALRDKLNDWFEGESKIAIRKSKIDDEILERIKYEGKNRSFKKRKRNGNQRSQRLS